MKIGQLRPRHRVREFLPREVTVRLRPRIRGANLIAVGRGRENLYQERVRIEGDIRHQRIQLGRGEFLRLPQSGQAEQCRRQNQDSAELS